MELFKRFKAFVKTKPSDQPIIHSSWRTCAIGEFTKAHLPQIDANTYTEFSSLARVIVPQEWHNFQKSVIALLTAI